MEREGVTDQTAPDTRKGGSQNILILAGRPLCPLNQVYNIRVRSITISLQNLKFEKYVHDYVNGHYIPKSGNFVDLAENLL